MNFIELTTSITNTLQVIAICLAIALPVGCTLAIALNRTNVFGRRFAWIALGSQLSVPLYVFAGGWAAGFGMQGWATALGWPLGFGLPQEGYGPLVLVGVIHALASIPWVSLIVSLGLAWSHRGQEEQAILDGGITGLIANLLLPKLRIWLFAAAAYCMLPIMTEMVVSNLYQVPTVAEQVYLDASRGSISPVTYVASVLVCIAPVAVCFALLLSRGPSWREVIYSASHFRSPVVELRRMRFAVSSFVWACLALLVGLPIFSLVVKAGWLPSVDAAGRTAYGWSPERFATTVVESMTQFGSEYSWSITLGVCAAGTALLVAWFLYAVLPKTARTAVGLCMLVVIAVPGPLVGMLVIWCLNRGEPEWLGMLYDQTIAAPVLAQQFRLLPLAWLLTVSIVASVSTSSWEQASLDGFGKWQTLRSVLWPQTGGLWIASGLLLFVLSVGELSCSILVLPPGVTTVSMRLFEMLHFGMRHQDSGICGVLILLGWAISLAFWNTLRDR